ncbi:peptidoglycan/LPS O-acetylase OafA/YrhL [Rhizobium sp. PP-F2F-G38]|nr:peptidoglycan/LPS O-acetylase OafA/YrhL [Rhizobium sp. PP-F2F-G38]
MGSVISRPHLPSEKTYLDFLDGLRAIAVGAVLWFHISSDTLPGGYIGVDVFFVISGFLITRICLSDGFSLADFWSARCRRILPAYFVTIVLVALLTSVILLPDDAETTARALLAAPLMLQNVVFWKQTSYFSPALESNPLLHTWTLAVEWQFYIGLPFVVIALRSSRRMLVLALVGLFAISFVLSAWGAVYKPTPTFYLVPFRAWEFLVGGIIALWSGRVQREPRFGTLLMTAGLAMIATSLCLYTPETIFPGFAALLPCLATAAVICGGLKDPQNLVSRLLSLRPLRAVGQASYSIYLVHWPIIVFVRYIVIDGEPPFMTVGIVAFSIGLGFLSWRFVEQPFRKKTAPGLSTRFVLSGGAMAVITSVAMVLLVTHGLPERASPDVRRILAARTDSGEFRHCLGFETPERLEASSCKLGADGAVSLVLWGDSTAAALADGVSAEARQMGIGGIFVGTDSCPPIPGMMGFFLEAQSRCQRIQNALPELLRQTPPEILIVKAAWSNHYAHHRKTFLYELMRAFADYRRLARRIVIVGPTPGAAHDVPSGLGRMAFFGRSAQIGLGEKAMEEMRTVNALVRQAASAQGFAFIDLTGQICQPDCTLTHGGLPIYFDSDHITATMSRQVARENAAILFAHPDNSAFWDMRFSRID